MEEIIARVAAAASIDTSVASRAIGIMLSFLRNHAPAEDVAALFAAFPGAEEAAATAEAGGLDASGGLMGLFGGGIMGVAVKLGALGLGPAEMQAIGRTLFDVVRARLGDDKVRAIAAAIPGLSQFL